MKIILTEAVEGLGEKMDIRDVADGHARNHLMPRGLAIPATKGAIRRAESIITERERRLAKEHKTVEAIADALANTRLVVTARVGERGRLHGSVTAQHIAEMLLQAHNIEVDARKIELPHPIKEVGTHSVNVGVGPGVSASLTVEVVPENEEENGS